MSLYFILFSIKKSKCNGSWNNINDPYAKLCVPDVVKNINLEVFNLMARTNETRHVKWDEICKSKCRLDVSVCNIKQLWNKGKCRSDLFDKGICNKGFIWNTNNRECEFGKSCDVGEYLDYEIVSAGKNQLIKEFTENIDEVKTARMALNQGANDCKSSYTIYVALIAIVSKISIEIGTYFIYYKYINHYKKYCF